MTVHKHYDNIFRVRADNGDTELFGQIKKVGAKRWDAEIRYSHSGRLKRDAGTWKTKKEAVEQCMFYIDSDHRAAVLKA